MSRTKAIGKSELDTFKSYFSEYKEQYVLIGGSATKILLIKDILRTVYGVS